VFDWLRTRKDPRVARNPAGFLISAIKDHYGVPPEYHAAQEQAIQALRFDEHQRRREQQQHQHRAAQDAEDQARRERIDQFWKSLSPEERQRQEQAALAQASALQRTLLAQGGSFARLSRQTVLDAFALGRLAQGVPEKGV
jgi:hypothetical protein